MSTSAKWRGDRLFAYILLLPSTLLLLGLVFIPFVQVVVTSFFKQDTGSTERTFVLLQNYKLILQNGQFFHALGRSLVWTFGTTALEMLVGLSVALLVHQQFVGRGIVRGIVLFPYLVPTIVAMLVWRYMFHDLLGVINYLMIEVGLISKPILWLGDPNLAMTSVIVVAVWKYFPFVVIALLGILQSIRTELYEAARVDGASPFQEFRFITWPAILPIFLVTTLLRTIWSFDKFDIIYMLTGGGPVGSTTTLPVLVYLKAFADWKFGQAAAIAVIMTLILLTVTLIYTRLYDEKVKQL